MTCARRGGPTLLLLALLACVCAPARADSDDDQPAPAPASAAQPALTPSQVNAVGIRLVHPRRGRADALLPAFGEVLDVASLAAATGELAGDRAAQRAADAEAQRLEGLFHDGADASMRAVESARAAALEARARTATAQAAFALQWGPLARMPEAPLDALLRALLAGRTALLRADLPGQVRLDRLPREATVQLDGAPSGARVLGTLPRAAAGSQSVGLLLQLDHPPPGLGAGTHLPVTLHGSPDSGVLVPAGALLYGEQGVYVYRQLARPGADGRQQYAPVNVQLLQRTGDLWLVRGVGDDDLIVADGAGVLWSLQGLGTFSAEEEDHD